MFFLVDDSWVFVPLLTFCYIILKYVIEFPDVPRNGLVRVLYIVQKRIGIEFFRKHSTFFKKQMETRLKRLKVVGTLTDRNANCTHTAATSIHEVLNCCSTITLFKRVILLY